MGETNFMKEVQMEASQLGGRLFRNNVGLYLTLDGTRKVRTGLCTGSSDLIGFFPKIVTQDMVGEKIAIFAAIETKSKKRKATEEQKRFIEMVKGFGGIAGEVKNFKDFWKLFGSY